MKIMKKEGASTISLNVVKTTFLFVTVPLPSNQKRIESGYFLQISRAKVFSES